MPSPFPGMDPYLEGDDWSSFHVHFASEIARRLVPLLRPNYMALLQKRYEFVEDEASIASVDHDVDAADAECTVCFHTISVGTASIGNSAPHRLQTVKLVTPGGNRSVTRRPAASDERSAAPRVVLCIRQPRGNSTDA